MVEQPTPDGRSSTGGGGDLGEPTDSGVLDVVATLVHERTSPPAVVAVAGSVAVGKTTVAEQLAEAIRRHTPGRDVRVLSTDAFLRPNAELDAEGLTLRKGFPESYDHDALQATLAAVHRGDAARVPTYSHQLYDVVPGQHDTLAPCDVLVLEGVNALQPRSVGDQVDVGIYVDAAEEDVEHWFVQRFLRLCAAPDAAEGFYGQFAGWDPAQVEAVARWTWTEINLVNLREHIAATAAHADVVLRKAADHRIEAVVVRDR